MTLYQQVIGLIGREGYMYASHVGKMTVHDILTDSQLLRRLSEEVGFIHIPQPRNAASDLARRLAPVAEKAAAEYVESRRLQRRLSEMRDYVERLRSTLKAMPGLFDRSEMPVAQLVEREVDLRVKLQAAGDILREAEKDAPVELSALYEFEAVERARRAYVEKYEALVGRLAGERQRIAGEIEAMEREGRSDELLKFVMPPPLVMDLAAVLRAEEVTVENLQLLRADEKSRDWSESLGKSKEPDPHQWRKALEEQSARRAG